MGRRAPGCSVPTARVHSAARRPALMAGSELAQSSASLREDAFITKMPRSCLSSRNGPATTSLCSACSLRIFAKCSSCSFSPASSLSCGGLAGRLSNTKKYCSGMTSFFPAEDFAVCLVTVALADDCIPPHWGRATTPEKQVMKQISARVRSFIPPRIHQRPLEPDTRRLKMKRRAGHWQCEFVPEVTR